MFLSLLSLKETRSIAKRPCELRDSTGNTLFVWHCLHPRHDITNLLVDNILLEYKGRDFLCRGQAEFQPIVIELYIELEIFLQEVNRIVPQKRGGFAEIKLLGLVRFVKTPIHQDRNRGLFVRAMVAGASWVVRRRL